jgi:hypothetical protein
MSSFPMVLTIFVQFATIKGRTKWVRPMKPYLVAYLHEHVCLQVVLAGLACAWLVAMLGMLGIGWPSFRAARLFRFVGVPYAILGIFIS